MSFSQGSPVITSFGATFPTLPSQRVEKTISLNLLERNLVLVLMCQPILHWLNSSLITKALLLGLLLNFISF